MILERTNIVIFITDQHNAGCMSCAGNPIVKTPRLDALASEGVRFTRAYCNSPSCVPSRHSFLSGKYPHETGVHTNGEFVPRGRNFNTFATILKKNGYETAAIGKMHFKPLDVPNALVDSHRGFTYRSAFLDASEGDVDMTFESAIGAPAYGKFMDEFHAYDGPGGETKKGYVGCTSALPERDHQDTWLIDDACAYISKRPEGRPFLLVISLDRPHPPSIVPPEFDTYRPDDIEMPIGTPDGFKETDKNLESRKEKYWSSMDENEIKTAIARYYGNVAYTDHLLGRVVDTLKTEGILDTTAMLYFSDHGEMLGARDAAFSKYNLYEDSIKVPLIIRWPGMLPAGTVSDSVVSLLDIFPTIMDIADVKGEVSPHGASLRGKSAKGASSPNAYVEMHNPDQKAVVTDNFKLILRSEEAGCDAFYDLRNDPREFDTKMDDPAYREIIDRLRADADENLP